jgi:hypothetical protein
MIRKLGVMAAKGLTATRTEIVFAKKAKQAELGDDILDQSLNAGL